MIYVDSEYDGDGKKTYNPMTFSMHVGGSSLIH